jgi:hypothetical protein
MLHCGINALQGALMVARIKTVSFRGVDVLDIDVEVQISSGFVAFKNVGYIKWITISFVFMLLLLMKPAMADNSPDWVVKNKIELKSAFKEKNCDKIWNLVWPEIQKGDPLSINFFLMLVRPFMHMDGISPPHVIDRDDWHFRDGVQLTIYALKVRDMGFQTWLDNETADSFLFDVLDQNIKARNFLGCLKENKGGRCRNIAIQDKVVPSFSEYTKEINDAIAQGKKPICRFYPDDPPATFTPLKEKP